MEHIYCEVIEREVNGAASVTHANSSYRALAWEISVGERVADRWPDDVSFKMDPAYPKDVKLVDSIINSEHVVLASPRFQEFFRDQKLPDLEFLKVTILDHKGRVAADDYAIVQCCRVVDCVDQDKSKFRWDGLDIPSMLARKLVFDQSKLSDEDRFFRARYVPALSFMREDLVEAIRAANFAGPAFKREIFGDYDYS